MAIKDYFATPEEDRLDKEFDVEIKNNLLGNTASDRWF